MSGVEFRPGFYHGENRCGGHVGEGEVVVGREGYDVAFSCRTLCTKEAGGERAILGRLVVVGLLLFHSGEIVDEDEGAVVVRVDIALGSFVAGAEVALLRLSVFLLSHTV